MMSMILQVGAVPLGFTCDLRDLEEPDYYCDRCNIRINSSSCFFYPTMTWQCLSNDALLPDLILSNSPPASPYYHPGGPNQKLLSPRTPLSQFSCYPPTPSPTPTPTGECHRCKLTKSSHSVDPSTRKVQLKLDHIQTVRRRILEDPEGQFLDQHGFCQRQQSLPQLTWNVPPPRRPQLERKGTQHEHVSPVVVDQSSEPLVVKDDSTEADGIQEHYDLTDLHWRQIGADLRFLADSFHLHHSSARNNNTLIGRAARALPSSVSYIVVTSVFILMTWRLIHRNT